MGVVKVNFFAAKHLSREKHKKPQNTSSVSKILKFFYAKPSTKPNGHFKPSLIKICPVTSEELTLIHTYIHTYIHTDRHHNVYYSKIVLKSSEIMDEDTITDDPIDCQDNYERDL